jgi:hypothetical protein
LQEFYAAAKEGGYTTANVLLPGTMSTGVHNILRLNVVVSDDGIIQNKCYFG